MKINELEVVFINLFGYLEKYKFAQYCFKRNCEKLKGAKITIIDENSEVYKEIKQLYHIDDNLAVCLSDYIRYFMLLNGKYTLYIDLDTIISDDSVSLILKNPQLPYINAFGSANILYSGQNKTQIYKIFSHIDKIGYLEYIENELDMGTQSLWKKESFKLYEEMHFSFYLRPHENNSLFIDTVKNIIFIDESDMDNNLYKNSIIFIRNIKNLYGLIINRNYYYYYSLNDLSYKESTDLIKEVLLEKEKLKGLNFIHII